MVSLPYDLSKEAQFDFKEILKRTLEEFGVQALEGYFELLVTSLEDLTENPSLHSSKVYETTKVSVRLYHIKNSKKRAAVNGKEVKKPRHIIAYNRKADGEIYVYRILHDAMDIPARLQEYLNVN